ncbi:hypothetical protein [Azospirillum doebereinerae]
MPVGQGHPDHHPVNVIGHSTGIRYPIGMDRSHLIAARLILDSVEPEPKTDDRSDDDRRDRARRILKAIRRKIFETYLH